MEEKSNDDKAKSEAENKNTGGWFLNRLQDACANYVLGYLDKESLRQLLPVQKQTDPVTKKSHYDNIKNLPVYQQHKRRVEYPKYFMWYVYGFGNAERLCKIVDDVLNKHKNEIGNDENKKFLLWHMILLDILNIKISDLKLDFEKEKSESVGEAIKNYLSPLTEEAVNRRNDFIDSKKIMSVSSYSETSLWEYSRQIFPEFKNVQLELEHTEYLNYKYIEIDLSTKELLRNIFTCFFKVSFYQMQIVKNLDEYKDNQLVYKRYKNQIYDFNRYLRGKIFYYVHGENINFSKYMAAYLFETGELDQWFLNYKKDFFNFFCRKNSFNELDEDEINIEFGYFAYYLNENKPLQTRYKENSNKFWRDFLTDITKKGSETEHDILEFCITPYIPEKSLKDKMKIEIMKMTGWSNEYLEASRHGVPYFFHHDFLIYYQSNAEKNYFNPIIIRFCLGKNLTDEGIQSISKVIESKDGVEHKAKANVVNNKVKSNLTDSNLIDSTGEQNCACEKKDESMIIHTKVNLAGKSQVYNNANDRLGDKNKIGSWQHFLFGLFFVLTCLSLFLCFEIQSLYFLIPFVVCFAVDLYLGFKNYCHCCCSTEKNIKIPFGNNGKYIPIELQSIDNNLPKPKLEKTVKGKGK